MDGGDFSSKNLTTVIMKRRGYSNTRYHTRRERESGDKSSRHERWMELSKETGREADREASKQIAGLYPWAGIQVRLQSGHWEPTRVCSLPTGAERIHRASKGTKTEGTKKG